MDPIYSIMRSSIMWIRLFMLGALIFGLLLLKQALDYIELHPYTFLVLSAGMVLLSGTAILLLALIRPDVQRLARLYRRYKEGQLPAQWRSPRGMYQHLKYKLLLTYRTKWYKRANLDDSLIKIKVECV